MSTLPDDVPSFLLRIAESTSDSVGVVFERVGGGADGVPVGERGGSVDPSIRVRVVQRPQQVIRADLTVLADAHPIPVGERERVVPGELLELALPEHDEEPMPRGEAAALVREVQVERVAFARVRVVVKARVSRGVVMVEDEVIIDADVHKREAGVRYRVHAHALRLDGHELGLGCLGLENEVHETLALRSAQREQVPPDECSTQGAVRAVVPPLTFVTHVALQRQRVQRVTRDGDSEFDQGSGLTWGRNVNADRESNT